MITRYVAGTVPTVSQGVVASTACINQDRECCVAELPIQVREIFSDCFQSINQSINTIETHDKKTG